MASRYIIPSISFVGAIISLLLVQKLLEHHVSDAVRQGVGWFAMWLALYPAVKFWSYKPESSSSSGKRRLNFLGWSIIGVLPAAVVSILYVLI